MSFLIVSANLGHAADLAPRLREADLRELRSSSGLPPERELARGVSCSRVAWAGLCPTSGKTILMAGVAPRGDGSGSPWLLGSPLMEDHRIAIGRITRPIVSEMLSHFPVLVNWADCRNTLHLAWLRWAGFSFLRTSTTYSLDGSPFVEFVKVKPHV